ncbi:MAG: S-adenosylmethionine:tRNA ribosyltransferase-isomerase [Thermoplasmata archaeon]|nr:S-adenosylmethionine:tRNA ribosyltransferase-isomerase [Thermoplasmata archaeon]MCI4355797.1 S-adenosylmethionine:tRNA ribosyltransferase-isomerase [Thermoplasmata archaeon]
MRTAELAFLRPPGLEATAPPELRRGSRDAVRLLVSRPHSRSIGEFPSVVGELRAGDLLVVNRSATVAASLPAEAAFGRFLLNLSTPYGRGIWVAETRFDAATPGPVPLAPGSDFSVGGIEASYVAEYPGVPRLGFFRLHGDVDGAMALHGRPIRYGYLDRAYPIEAYQAVYADRPGSAEMPSAGRPFTPRLLATIARAGVRIASITLHAGVSSVEIGSEDVAATPIYPEPFEVPAATASAVAATRGSGGRVVAVGTTVVRALESAREAAGIVPTRGFARAFVRPERPPVVVDALLTGFHDPRTSHLAMLAAFAGLPRLREDYESAIEARLLWHEFGDSHLIFRDASPS